MRKILLFSVASLVVFFFAFKDDKSRFATWSSYLGGPERTHYSTLAEITIENVANLKVAWEFHSKDSGQVQCNPIVVDGVLFGNTASAQTFALDAATGKEIWRFDVGDKAWYTTNRGVSYWENEGDKRIFTTVGSNLYALNAATGKPILSFGDGGKISLKKGLSEQAQKKFVISNTPGTIYKDLIIMPIRLSEGPDAALGHVRAFNVKTGELAWMFKTIPEPNEYGYSTWERDNYKNEDVGGANNWAGMALDVERGIVFVPTGSAAFDFYGGNRKGNNLFANCLLALDASTGKRLWHYQFIHHDVWDRDLPSPPVLTTIVRNGKSIDAVTQITKSGFVFVFDRVSGKPVFPIKEMAVPTNGVLGEKPSPTQPVPLLPAPFSRQTITENDISPLAENREELIKTLRSIRHKNQFELPSKEGTLIFPGYDGGGEWGGPAFDPETGILYVNSNEMAWIMTMVNKPKADELANLSTGERAYTQYCTACHGKNRAGNPKSGYPNLQNLSARRDRTFTQNIISNGKGMMPGFSYVSAADKEALTAFLFDEEKKEVSAQSSNASKDPFPNIPYKTTGYNKFLDKKGYPAISPPWGQLSAINLNTGKYVWQQPFGELKELTAKGIAPTGCENYGGPVVTSSGLLFIAATKDGMFRAYNKKTGKLLFETKLPATGFATPTTYQVNGKQYVVIACGGTKLGTPKGDSYVAFAL